MDLLTNATTLQTLDSLFPHLSQFHPHVRRKTTTHTHTYTLQSFFTVHTSARPLNPTPTLPASVGLRRDYSYHLTSPAQQTKNHQQNDNPFGLSPIATNARGTYDVLYIYIHWCPLGQPRFGRSVNCWTSLACTPAELPPNPSSSLLTAAARLNARLV